MLDVRGLFSAPTEREMEGSGGRRGEREIERQIETGLNVHTQTYRQTKILTHINRERRGTRGERKRGREKCGRECACLWCILHARV